VQPTSKAAQADDKARDTDEEDDSWADGLEEEPPAVPADGQAGALAAAILALTASQTPAEPIDDEDWLAAADEAERSASRDATGEDGMLEGSGDDEEEEAGLPGSAAGSEAEADVPVLLINTASFVEDAPAETGGDHDRALAMVWTVLTGLPVDDTAAMLDGCEAEHHARQAHLGAASIRIPSPPSLPATDSIGFCGRAEELFAEGRAWHSTRLRAGADRTEAERMVPGSQWRVLPYPLRLGQVETARAWSLVSAASPIQAVNEALLAVRACHKDPLWKMRAVEVLLDMAEEAGGAVEARREAVAAEKRALRARGDALRRVEAVDEAMQDSEELEAAVKEARADLQASRAVSASSADSDDDQQGAEAASQAAVDTPASRRRHKRRARRFLAGAEAMREQFRSAAAQARAALVLSARLAVEASRDARIACRAVASWPAGGLEIIAVELESLDLSAPAPACAGLGGVLEAESLVPWLVAEDTAARGVLVDELQRGGLESHEAERALPQALGAARLHGAGCAWLFAQEDRSATRRGAGRGSAGRAGCKEGDVAERLLRLSEVDREESTTAIEASRARLECLSDSIVFGADAVARAHSGRTGRQPARPSMAAMSPLTVLLAVVLHRHPQLHPQPGVSASSPGVPPNGKLASGEALAAAAASAAASAASTASASSNAVAYALVQGGGLGPEALQSLEELEQLWRRAFGTLPAPQRTHRSTGRAEPSGARQASASGADEGRALNWDALPSVGLRWGHLEEEDGDDTTSAGAGIAATAATEGAQSGFDWESLADAVSGKAVAGTRAKGSSRHSKPASSAASSKAKAPPGSLAAKLAAATRAAIDNS
jgi:hypothetical protein